MLPLADIQVARDRCAPYVVETPLVGSPRLSEELGTDVCLKLEYRQTTGSFKPRGAVNSILALDTEARAGPRRGVSTWIFVLGHFRGFPSFSYGFPPVFLRFSYPFSSLFVLFLRFSY